MSEKIYSLQQAQNEAEIIRILAFKIAKTRNREEMEKLLAIPFVGKLWFYHIVFPSKLKWGIVKAIDYQKAEAELKDVEIVSGQGFFRRL